MSGGFEDWMKAVDRALFRKIGLTSADLPDACFHDWYDDEIPPSAAAQLLLEGGP